MNKPDVNLHIDALVLEGFAHGDRHRVGEAVRLELARLLSEQGVPRPWTRGGAMARLDGGAFEVAPGSRAEVMGAQVAESVFRSLDRITRQQREAA
jgi:hypothetical protein